MPSVPHPPKHKYGPVPTGTGPRSYGPYRFGNHSLISAAAVSGASLPWIRFCSVLFAKSPRMLPGIESLGFVAPMTRRARAMTSGPSSGILEFRLRHSQCVGLDLVGLCCELTLYWRFVYDVLRGRDSPAWRYRSNMRQIRLHGLETHNTLFVVNIR